MLYRFSIASSLDLSPPVNITVLIMMLLSVFFLYCFFCVSPFSGIKLVLDRLRTELNIVIMLYKRGLLISIVY